MAAIVSRCVLGVVLLHAAVLLTFAMTPSWWLPAPGGFWAMVWGYFHQPQFYPLLAAIAVSPLLSVIAWRGSRWHRAALLVVWCAFLALLLCLWRDRTTTMLYVVWQLISDRW